MRIRNIAFDEGEEISTVSVDMTIREAALIVRMIGPTTHAQRQEIQSDGGAVGSDIFDALDGGVFNRFWDGGIKGVGA